MVSMRLSASEFDDLFDELDTSKGGHITQAMLRDKFSSLLRKEINLRDEGRDSTSEIDEFCMALLGASGNTLLGDDVKYTKASFRQLIEVWSVKVGDEALRGPDRSSRITTIARRLRAHVVLHRASLVFIALVVVLQSLTAYLQVRVAVTAVHLSLFGPFLYLSKIFAGLLCPTLALMVLSCSRWLETWMRRSPLLCRLVNWDYAQKFHIWMASLSTLMGITHGLSHLAGDLPHALRHRDVLEEVLQSKLHKVPTSMADIFRLRAVWTGVCSLGIFVLIATSGWLRRKVPKYEVFQLVHLLMYPLFGLLIAHGTQQLLARSILGYWLAIPVLLVTIERIYRNVWLGLVTGKSNVASLVLLDANMVKLAVEASSSFTASCRPGQYAILHIPAISRFQWHPFTISGVEDGNVIFHIRISGNWTRRLRDFAGADFEDKATGFDECKNSARWTSVHIDGPYGAPTRRFFEYDNTIIFGAGVGMTPFSAVLAHIAEKLRAQQSPWKRDSKQLKIVSTPLVAAEKPSPLATESIDIVVQQDYQVSPSLEQPSFEAALLTSPPRPPKALARIGSDSYQHLPSPSSVGIKGSTSSSRCSTPIDRIASSAMSTPSRSSYFPQHRASATTAVERLSTAQDQMKHWTKQASNALVNVLASQRSIEIHWSVRTEEEAAWLLDLLRALSIGFAVEVTIHLYVTGQKMHDSNSATPISDQVFRQLLDMPPPCVGRNMPSLLTGLRLHRHAGRPNVQDILAAYHRNRHGSLAHAEQATRAAKAGANTVGVFMCGPKPMKDSIRDACLEMTSTAMHDGTRTRYRLHAEVF